MKAMRKPWKMITETFSEKETFELGYELGKKAKAGSVYCLDGDLGAGKTVFTKGFAAGMGITEDVSSPTFMIVQEYDGGEMNLYHFDVYRIADPDEMFDIGFEEYLSKEGVCLIEWSCIIEDILPENCIKIRITRDPSKGFDYRKIEIAGEPD